ncbi:protein of unknown function [Nitrospina watsonii]|uniref:Uncharacterized protein n=1 Tax=Nitrospina watsonii TaxID=1323948 RepID=A0ABM9HBK3_9BACT|nr:protein of unknown function [Nitrospina watsonii]
MEQIPFVIAPLWFISLSGFLKFHALSPVAVRGQWAARTATVLPVTSHPFRPAVAFAC